MSYILIFNISALNLCIAYQSFVMIRNKLLILFVVLTSSASSQGIHIGVFGGVSVYNGDLTEKIFSEKTMNGVVGLTGTYEFTDHIMARAGFTYTILGAADRYNKSTDLQLRNLSFETKLFEFSLMGEYDLFSLNEKRFTPYVMAGVAVFRYDPYIYYTGKVKIFLQPLSTEGQGISGYGDKYSLTQFAIPFGGGIKYAINDKLRIGLEAHVRKTFTDYLDDVSTNYADANDLFNARGQLAVDVSYRGDEVQGGNPLYPARGAQRGSSEAKDLYYFTGLHLTYRIADGGFGGGGGGRSKLGCPTNIY